MLGDGTDGGEHPDADSWPAWRRHEHRTRCCGIETHRRGGTTPLPPGRVYLVVLGRPDHWSRRSASRHGNGWMISLARVKAFCHLPYQVRLGCAGGAILDLAIARLAVETLISPAFRGELPAVRDVSAVRLCCMRVSIQVPDALRESWVARSGRCDGKRRQPDVTADLGVCAHCRLLVLLLAAGMSRRRARRAHHRLAVDLATRLANAPGALRKFDELRWGTAVCADVGLRDYRQHVGLPRCPGAVSRAAARVT
ncbi:hypothetical protein DSL92_04190 [Billgrantia gudaonensis]|uniref:Uncharacterized protein n=1 Tax=Billgrantia gudaonensis TaxID=376427 RepID=A0A432JJL7_9GAMM|nr:hypothetical protein DSL92_04190 [Halomonas gudaonensis]